MELLTKVTYRGRLATIVSRCYVSGEWLYGLRFPSGKIIDYIPGSKLKVVTD